MKTAYILYIRPTEKGVSEPVVVKGSFFRVDGSYSVIRISELWYEYVNKDPDTFGWSPATVQNSHVGWSRTKRGIKKLWRKWVMQKIAKHHEQIAADKQSIAFWKEFLKTQQPFKP